MNNDDGCKFVGSPVRQTHVSIRIVNIEHSGDQGKLSVFYRLY